MTSQKGNGNNWHATATTATNAGNFQYSTTPSVYTSNQTYTGSGTWTAPIGISGMFSFNEQAWTPPKCSCCDVEIDIDDVISVNISDKPDEEQKNGKKVISFHKKCYLDPDNQRRIRSLIIGEDLGII
jgi:hypothetical protein